MSFFTEKWVKLLKWLGKQDVELGKVTVTQVADALIDGIVDWADSLDPDNEELQRALALLQKTVGDWLDQKGI